MEEEAPSISETVSAVGVELASDTRSLLHLDDVKQFFTWHNLIRACLIFLTVLFLFVIYFVIKRYAVKRAAAKMEPHKAVLVNKIITYTFYIGLAMYILSLFGVNLGAIWGAAGVAGLAIGFAAQTSVSNLISGFFVLLEKSLKIGDYITIDGVSGTVDNIRLLSITIRTLDNQMIRIPNSTIINTNLINYNHFPIRRMVFDIPLSYDTDLQKALDVAQQVPPLCSCALDTPAPLAYYDTLDSAIHLKLAVWIQNKDFILCKNQVYTTAVHVFKENGITLRPARYDIHILEPLQTAP